MEFTAGYVFFLSSFPVQLLGSIIGPRRLDELKNRCNSIITLCIFQSTVWRMYYASLFNLCAARRFRWIKRLVVTYESGKLYCGGVAGFIGIDCGLIL